MFEISYQCFPYHRGYLRIGTFFDLALGRLCDDELIQLGWQSHRHLHINGFFSVGPSRYEARLHVWYAALGTPSLCTATPLSGMWATGSRSRSALPNQGLVSGETFTRNSSGPGAHSLAVFEAFLKYDIRNM